MGCMNRAHVQSLNWCQLWKANHFLAEDNFLWVIITIIIRLAINVTGNFWCFVLWTCSDECCRGLGKAVQLSALYCALKYVKIRWQIGHLMRINLQECYPVMVKTAGQCDASEYSFMKRSSCNFSGKRMHKTAQWLQMLSFTRDQLYGVWESNILLLVQL